MLCSVIAQPVTYDTLTKAPVKIDETIEKEIFSREEYKYRETTSAGNVFSDFFKWLIRKLFGDFNDDNVNKFWFILKILLGLLFIAGVIFLLFKSKASRLFRGESSNVSLFTDIGENIDELNLELLKEAAIATEDYKLAFRYSFLESLQLMSKKEFIDWKPYKTNYEYFIEFRGNKLSPLFRDLYIGFEYVWYGDTEIDKDVYETYRNEFSEFNQKLGV